MICIITMAGRGQRFRDQGYELPKYEIEANGGTLFEWSISSLQPWIKSKAKFVFVSLAENRAQPFIAYKATELKIQKFDCVEIPEVTDGQASTVLLAAKAIKEKDEPIVIFNVDTHIRPEALSTFVGLQLFAPCFEMPGDHWSFFAKNNEGFATQAAEKVRISPWASVGLYGFESFEQFEAAYRATYEGPKATLKLKERYVAPLYNWVIESGGKVSVPMINKQDVIPIGTPSELEQLIQSGVVYEAIK